MSQPRREQIGSVREPTITALKEPGLGLPEPPSSEKQNPAPLRPREQPSPAEPMITIDAAAMAMSRLYNRPQNWLIKELRLQVEFELASGASFDKALAVAKKTIAQQIIAGLA